MPAEFHFIRPWWLLAIVPAAVLLYLLFKNKYRRGDWTQVCDSELLPYILHEKPTAINPAGWITASLATLLTILALAGPAWERLPSPAFRNDSALVIALDLSKSMDATDVKPSRISRARYKISDILKLRKDGQTALLVYSGDAFTVTPLTTDTATINSQLEALTTDIMPSPGSNTVTALEKSVDLLRQAGLAQGDILLVTDGTDADSVAKAGRLLGDYRLSILALGTPEGAPIPLPGGGFLKDDRGNMVVAKLESSELSRLATAGHGLFRRATANDDDIESLSAQFDQGHHADSARLSDSLLQNWDEKGPWLLLAVLPWAALQFRRGLMLIVLCCLLPYPGPASALDWNSLWRNRDQQGQHAFQQQRYEQAAERFDDPDWRAAAQYKAGEYQKAAESLKDANTADQYYNRGNALAKAGQLQQAIEDYSKALALDPQHADAQYNKELLEKQQQQQQDKQSSDQSKQDQQSNEQQAQDQKPGSENQQQQNQDQQNQTQQSQSENSQQQQSQSADQKKAGDQTDNEQHNQDKQQPEPGADVDRPEDARRSPNDKAEPATQSKQDAQPAAEQDEIQRANEQLLKRIPDEPTGLLKRKFRYQYGQREPPPHAGPDW